MPPGYRLLGVIAEGPDFVTYDAWSERRFARCVVKTIAPGRESSTTLPARLLREGRLLRRLSHPHLVRAYEVVTAPAPAVVLETLAGHTLRSALRERGRPLSSGDLMLLGSQLGSALAYLHEHRQLHLDLKPRNIVIDGFRAKLLDLSLGQASGRVKPGHGTASYLSPEQAMGGRVTAATDVWGLGIVLYEAATQTSPFSSRTSGTSDSTSDCPTCGKPRGGYRQLTTVAPPLRGLRRLPRQLSAAIDGSLDPRPESRPTLAQLQETFGSLP